MISKKKRENTLEMLTILRKGHSRFTEEGKLIVQGLTWEDKQENKYPAQVQRS